MDGESDLVLGLAASALSGLSSAYAGSAAAVKCHMPEFLCMELVGLNTCNMPQEEAPV